jgi:hypothetical protein
MPRLSRVTAWHGTLDRSHANSPLNLFRKIYGRRGYSEREEESGATAVDEGAVQHARNEAEIEMVVRALRSAAKPNRTPETLSLPTVVNELGAWLRDPHQWGSAFSDNWKSLIEDLERSLTTCGPELREMLDVGEPSGHGGTCRLSKASGATPPTTGSRRDHRTRQRAGAGGTSRPLAADSGSLNCVRIEHG